MPAGRAGRMWAGCDMPQGRTRGRVCTCCCTRSSSSRGGCAARRAPAALVSHLRVRKCPSSLPPASRPPHCFTLSSSMLRDPAPTKLGHCPNTPRTRSLAEPALPRPRRSASPSSSVGLAALERSLDAVGGRRRLSAWASCRLLRCPPFRSKGASLRSHLSEALKRTVPLRGGQRGAKGVGGPPVRRRRLTPAGPCRACATTTPLSRSDCCGPGLGAWKSGALSPAAVQSHREGLRGVLSSLRRRAASHCDAESAQSFVVQRRPHTNMPFSRHYTPRPSIDTLRWPPLRESASPLRPRRPSLLSLLFCSALCSIARRRHVQGCSSECALRGRPRPRAHVNLDEVNVRRFARACAALPPY